MGLVVGILLLVALCPLRTLLVVEVLTIGFLGCVFSLVSSPTMALITDVAERTEYETAAPAMQLMAIAIGDLVGSSGGAALAQASNDAVSYAALAFLSFGSLVLLRIAVARPLPIPAVPSGE